MLKGIGANLKGFGSSIIITGDTIQSYDPVSGIVTTLTGGTNKFHFEKGNGDNSYNLDLPNNKKVPLFYKASEKNVVLLFDTGDSLVYHAEEE